MINHSPLVIPQSVEVGHERVGERLQARLQLADEHPPVTRQ